MGDKAWYIRLRRDKAVGLDKQFSLDQLFCIAPDTSKAPYQSKNKRDELVEGGITLGRQSSSLKEGPNTRGFCSPIVSRSHAQVTVSQRGHVYIADLDSLHGTMIYPADKSQRPITLEAYRYTQLLEGDTVTLGKTVHALEQSHDPIRVVIEFAYAPAGMSAERTRHILAAQSFNSDTYPFATSKHLIDILRSVAPDSPKPKTIFDSLIQHKAKPAAAVVQVLSVPSSPEGVELLHKEDRESSVEPIDRPQNESGRYGVPHSLLYVSSDEEDLPRGNGQQDREQSDDSAASTSYSEHSVPRDASSPAPTWNIAAPQAVRPLASGAFNWLAPSQDEPAASQSSRDPRNAAASRQSLYEAMRARAAARAADLAKRDNTTPSPKPSNEQPGSIYPRRTYASVEEESTPPPKAPQPCPGTVLSLSDLYRDQTSPPLPHRPSDEDNFYSHPPLPNEMALAREVALTAGDEEFLDELAQMDEMQWASQPGMAAQGSVGDYDLPPDYETMSDRGEPSQSEAQSEPEEEDDQHDDDDSCDTKPRPEDLGSDVGSDVESDCEDDQIDYEENAQDAGTHFHRDIQVLAFARSSDVDDLDDAEDFNERDEDAGSDDLGAFDGYFADLHEEDDHHDVDDHVDVDEDDHFDDEDHYDEGDHNDENDHNDEDDFNDEGDHIDEDDHNEPPGDGYGAFDDHGDLDDHGDDDDHRDLPEGNDMGVEDSILDEPEAKDPAGVEAKCEDAEASSTARDEQLGRDVSEVLRLGTSSQPSFKWSCSRPAPVAQHSTPPPSSQRPIAGNAAAPTSVKPSSSDDAGKSTQIEADCQNVHISSSTTHVQPDRSSVMVKRLDLEARLEKLVAISQRRKALLATEESDDGGEYTDDEDPEQALSDDEECGEDLSEDEVDVLRKEKEDFAIRRLSVPPMGASVDRAATPVVDDFAEKAASGLGHWYSYSDAEDDAAPDSAREDKMAVETEKKLSADETKKNLRDAVALEISRIKKERSGTPSASLSRGRASGKLVLRESLDDVKVKVQKEVEAVRAATAAWLAMPPSFELPDDFEDEERDMSVIEDDEEDVKEDVEENGESDVKEGGESDMVEDSGDDLSDGAGSEMGLGSDDELDDQASEESDLSEVEGSEMEESEIGSRSGEITDEEEDNEEEEDEGEDEEEDDDDEEEENDEDDEQMDDEEDRQSAHPGEDIVVASGHDNEDEPYEFTSLSWTSRIPVRRAPIVQVPVRTQPKAINRVDDRESSASPVPAEPPLSRYVSRACSPTCADSPTQSLSSLISSDGPVTPQSNRKPLKRSRDEMVDAAAGSDDPDSMRPYDLDNEEPSPVKVVKRTEGGDVKDRRAERAESTGLVKAAQVVGWMALGAVVGSVGTVVGLMQIAD